MRDLITGDAWLEEAEGWVRVHPEVQALCSSLSERATRYAPPLITNEYRILVAAHSPEAWKRVGHRVTVRLVRRGSEEKNFGLEVVSTGVATWTAYAIAEAMRQIRDEREGQDVTGRPTLFLIDEPERHLHPSAQEEIASWLAQTFARGTTGLVATHAVPFLRLPLADVEYVGIQRDADGNTRAISITHDVIGAVRESSGSLGLPPAALIQLARGWLFVEGEDDRRVLDALFGRDLRAAGIVLLRFHGAGRAKATFESLELLSQLDLPIYALLDNVRAAAVEGNELPEPTEEEKIVEQIIHARRNGADVRVRPFTYPDVLCAVPEEAIRQALKTHGLPADGLVTWDALIREFEAARAAGEEKRFKPYALKMLKWRGSVSDLIEAALGDWRGTLPPSHELARRIKSITAELAGNDHPVPAPSDPPERGS